jgi:hypothetical protein
LMGINRVGKECLSIYLGVNISVILTEEGL